MTGVNLPLDVLAFEKDVESFGKSLAGNAYRNIFLHVDIFVEEYTARLFFNLLHHFLQSDVFRLDGHCLVVLCK